MAKKTFYSFFSIFAVLVFSVCAFAQETEVRVVDEVVAQVNEGVITLSKVKREIEDSIKSLVGEGKSREEAEKLVKDKQGELIASLINEELLTQKAKESGLDSEIEASINQRFIEIMKQQKIKTLEQLFEEMHKSGVEPDALRELWRAQVTKDLVIQREVRSKVYWDATPKEMRAFYEKNKDKFKKKETVTLSEIFLSFAGNDPAALRERAKKLVEDLRKGADFAKMVNENSDRPNAAKNGGKVDTFEVTDLDEKFTKGIKGIPAGGYSDPIELDEVGIEILRVDERSAASDESVFDESAIRLAIMQEKYPSAQRNLCQNCVKMPT